MTIGLLFLAGVALCITALAYGLEYHPTPITQEDPPMTTDPTTALLAYFRSPAALATWDAAEARITAEQVEAAEAAASAANQARTDALVGA